MTKAFGEGNPKVAIAVDIANTCAKITDPDRCELASKMYACAKEEAAKKDLKFEDFM